MRQNSRNKRPATPEKALVASLPRRSGTAAVCFATAAMYESRLCRISLGSLFRLVAY